MRGFPAFAYWMIAVFFLCISAMAYADGFRCNGRIVQPGLVATQVQNNCGAPFWTDAYTSLEIFGAGGPVEEQREVNWEVWYYNFGRGSFMQRLTFRNGQLRAVEPLGYGVDEIGTSCLHGAVSRGLTTGELVARCGEPTSRRLRDGALIRRSPYLSTATEERWEDWIYDDAEYLTRYIITNGSVVASERLPR